MASSADKGAINLTEEQAKLWRLVMKHSETPKPNWDVVKAEGGYVNATAVAKRWRRLLASMMGGTSSNKTAKDRKATPRKGKTSHSDKNAGDSDNDDYDDGDEEVDMPDLETTAPRSQKRKATQRLDDDALPKREKK